MNGWSALTTTEVLAQFNDSETTAYDVAKGDPTSTALPDIISKVMDEITQAYSDGGRFTDTTTGSAPVSGTIPAGEKNRAIAIARWLYLLAIPSGKSLAENRADAAKQARDYFLAIAKREIAPPGNVAIARPGRRVHTNSFNGMSGT